MKKILACCILLLIASIAAAETFTIHKVIEIGLDNSYDIIQENYELKKSKQNLYSSFLQILPSVNVKYDILSNKKSSVISEGSDRLFISESIKSNDNRYFTIKNNLSSLRKSKINLEDKRRNLIFNIINNYLKVLENEKQFEVKKMALNIAKMNYEETKTLRSYGKKAELDMRQAEIDLSRAQIDSLSSYYDFENSKMELCFLLNIDYNKNDTFTEFDYVIKEDEEMRFDETTNLTLKSSIEDVRKSKNDYIQNWLDFFPTLSFSVSKTLDWEKKGIFDFDRKSAPMQYTLALSYPLLSPLTNLPTNKNYHYKLKQSQLMYQYKRREEQQNFEQTLTSFKQLKQSYELAKKQENLSEMHFNLVNEKYRLGQADLTELENARQERFKSMSDRISQYYNLILAQESLHLIMNTKLLNTY